MINVPNTEDTDLVLILIEKMINAVYKISVRTL